MKHHTVIMFLACMAVLSPLTAQAQLVGTDTVPGTPCTAKGSVLMSANATGPGAYILTCDDDSGQWRATINAELPTANAQVANKQYVDTAVAGNIPSCTDNTTGLCILETPRAANDPEFTAANIANGVNILGVTGAMAGGGCTDIGDLCPDGTVYAGYHPTLLVPLYIPTTDQGTTQVWKTSTGTNDIATDSIDDGRVNSNQVPNDAAFPAFKLCKDLTTGGHSDWYLPSQVELYYLWSVRTQIEAKGNITNFQNAVYGSSTEYSTNDALVHIFASGYQFSFSKTFAVRTRCVRR